jgi:hypothetical protein
MINKKILSLLGEIDLLFKNFYTWLSSLYDYETGGFYYAKSSITSSEFKPDIESTGQAIHILERSNLMRTLPEWMKIKFIEFFQKRQDSKTGFFYDPQNGMREVDRMVARALAYSVNCLSILGTKPLYPVPGQKGLDSLPEHLKTKEKLVKWMEERDWSYSWMACDNISATSIYMRNLPEKEKNEYLDIIWNFLERKQDKETGMWGEGRPYVKISGAFKLSLFYNNLGQNMPNLDIIYKFLLKTLREDISEDMCWTRNPIDMLNSLKPKMGILPENELSEIIEITYNNLKKYLKPDGGFSRHLDISLAMPNNVQLGKGLVEGDMNAGTQALKIRDCCYLLATPPALEYSKQFQSVISNMKK